MEPARPGPGKSIWVLSRPLYRFKHFDLSQVPGNKREQALKLQLAQWNPYVGGGHVIAWFSGGALAWFWDRELVEQQIEQAGLDPRRVEVLPETVLYPATQDGLRLIRTLEGIEGQFWKQGTLLHSRFWDEIPLEAEWVMFQRDLGLQPDFAFSPEQALQSLHRLDRPWAGLSGGAGYLDRKQKIERLGYVAAVILFSIPTLWYGSALIKVNRVIDASKAQVETFNQKIQPLLEARSGALESLSRIDDLNALDPYPDQLALMVKVAAALPGNGSYLREWDYQNGKLRIVVVSPAGGLTASTLVSALQQAGPFRNVGVLPGSDQKVNSLQMDVVSLSGLSRHA